MVRGVDEYPNLVEYAAAFAGTLIGWAMADAGVGIISTVAYTMLFFVAWMHVIPFALSIITRQEVQA